MGSFFPYSKEEFEEISRRLQQPPVMPTPPNRDQTMTTSLDEILKERGNRYGKFSEHAHVTQEFKLLYDRMCSSYGTSDEARIEADQREAMDMIFHKIGRIVCGDPNYSDSWRDIAGYAKLVADRLDGVEQ
jgi:hypothetical protein